jgi:hypothetical protein
MVVQMKAISQITSGQMEQVFRERAAQLKSGVAERIADDIVNFSPVDTGTYIMAHKAAVGGSDAEPSRRSDGKIRGRNPEQFRNLARGNLKRSVSSAAVLNATEVWFNNSAMHAAKVESLGWPSKGPYRVYAQARNRVPLHVKDVAGQLGMTSR